MRLKIYYYGYLPSYCKMAHRFYGFELTNTDLIILQFVSIRFIRSICGQFATKSSVASQLKMRLLCFATPCNLPPTRGI